MKEIINILLLLILGIAYLVAFTKIISGFLNKITTQRNNAIITLFISAIAAAGIVIIDISKVISDAFSFFWDNSQIALAIGFTLLLFIGSWIFSLLLFHGSFFLVSLITKEDEKVELNKNNIELALVHGVIIIIIAFLIGPALSQFASIFIPKPELPF